ncbi:tetratricopeptide repeat protein [Alicyclobacillus fastidiosus]|uniref:Tetratricopeptide repeat protein n=1 Tax=Alicyclobacillus fastidiosus TaxID=392011 RepID=A0ABV5ACL2_9BACL|nr:tetratricopeptide repeat protein [Alicyclobacillus fastidiosus]WEH11864.1 tetratricopeptide repeat protein [Alicyclobacillus fastidiosus]
MSAARLIQAAYAYLYIGDFAEAKAAFERAIQEEPDNAEAYFCASITAHRSGHNEEAEAYIERAMSLSPDVALYSAQYHTIRASRFVEQARLAYIEGQVDAALRLLEQAVAEDPLNDEAQAMKTELSALHPSDEDAFKEDSSESTEPDSNRDCRCQGEDGARSC